MAPDLLRRIEAMNVHGRESQWSFIPDELARSAKPHVEHIGDSLVTFMRGSDSLRVNRVIGLGHRSEATESVIDRILARYRTANLRRFCIELAPSGQRDAIEVWLLRRGFRRHGGYSMLVRDLGVPVATVPTTLRIVRAGRTRIEHAVDIFGSVFGAPKSRRAWSLAAARRGVTKYFLALQGSAPVGAAALRIEDDLAWLIGGATLTRWRHRGAHGALIAARLRAAQVAGCRHAWSETLEPVPGRPQGSRRNMMRLGFEEVGVKRMFVWERS
jgi:hypothetical protein